MVEVSKISSKGQVTIPVELRKLLQLTDGSKVAFITDETGKVYITNSSMLALKETQVAFDGVAEKVGLKDETQVADFIKSALKD